MWTATGDFNGDGRTDVAVGSNGATYITTYYQQPDGTLPMTGSTTATASVPTRLSAGDFNADGRADLVYLDDNAGMKLRYGQAGNTFSGPTTLGPSGVFPSWGKTAVGDLNRDGRLDAMIAISNSTTATGRVGLAYAQPGGTYTNTSFATSSDPNGIAQADLNGDLYPDIILGDNFGGSGIKVAYGSASGTFTLKSFAYGDRGYSIVARDFNGDRIPDIAVAAWNRDAVGILLTQPNGDLGPPSFFAASLTPDSIAAGDFNGDGLADLALGSQNFNTVSILLGNGDGSFGHRLNLLASANGSSTVSVADLDGNGSDDIAVAFASGQNLDIFYNTIPEPTATTLLALIAGVIALRRRCRQ